MSKKAWILVLPFVTLIGCTLRNVAVNNTQSYFTRDTIVADHGPMTYVGTKLCRGGEIIDTIASVFGYHQVGRDSILFQRLIVNVDTVWSENRDSVIEVRKEGEQGGLVIFDGFKKQNVDSISPLYSYFSSPAIIDGDLIYWGVGPKKDGLFPIYAVRFQFKKNWADSVYLFLHALETDNSSFFYPPRKIKGGYLFRGEITDSIVVNGAFNKKRNCAIDLCMFTDNLE